MKEIPSGYVTARIDQLTDEVVIEFGDAYALSPPDLLRVRRVIFDGDDGKARWLRDLRISPDSSIAATWMETP